MRELQWAGFPGRPRKSAMECIRHAWWSGWRNSVLQSHIFGCCWRSCSTVDKESQKARATNMDDTCHTQWSVRETSIPGYRYRICTKVWCIRILFEYTTTKFTLVSRSNFSKTRKNYYIPEICKNSKTTPLRMHKKNNRWIHFRKIFLCVAVTHSLFLLPHMFLWCSFTTNGWSYGINKRDQNNSGAKALRILIFLWKSKMQLSVTSSYNQKWIYPWVMILFIGIGFWKRLVN